MGNIKKLIKYLGQYFTRNQKSGNFWDPNVKIGKLGDLKAIFLAPLESSSLGGRRPL